MLLEDLIAQSQQLKASDIHITEGGHYKHRIDGDIHVLPDVISSEEFDAFCNKYEIACGKNVNSFDAAVTVCNIRMRVNLYQSIAGRKLALRILSDKIPRFEDLNLAPSVQKIVSLKQGLVLITGVTGSGKTTTLASLIDIINETRSDHIITIEQPVEYVFPEKNCIISQREVGKHTPSFTQATIDAMREDPDIVMLGEMRDLPTMQNAITLAETGHLVIGTLHCRNAVEAVDRIVDVFPPEQQAGVRIQACNVIQCVISQSLVHKKPSGRYCLQEVLYFSDSVRNLLKQHKPINQVRSIMPTNPDCVDVMASAIRGIKDFGVEPYEVWTYMGLDDNEKDMFIQRCDAAGVPAEDTEFLRSKTAVEAEAEKAAERKEAAAQPAPRSGFGGFSTGIFGSNNLDGGWT